MAASVSVGIMKLKKYRVTEICTNGKKSKQTLHKWQEVKINFAQMAI
jgi:hypothetical protein